ncbi:hypothetical protein [Maribacter sp. 2304DJ31-5]|uniref:hypothetical protein n=1 Tax=Maribacter sp. 2304DJ31-5 TaxID=3386273 RepID=UPI0039BD3833
MIKDMLKSMLFGTVMISSWFIASQMIKGDNVNRTVSKITIIDNDEQNKETFVETLTIDYEGSTK